MQTTLSFHGLPKSRDISSGANVILISGGIKKALPIPIKNNMGMEVAYGYGDGKPDPDNEVIPHYSYYMPRIDLMMCNVQSAAGHRQS
jgi:hypothetical protein